MFVMILMLFVGCGKKDETSATDNTSQTTSTTVTTQKSATGIEISTEATNKAFHMGDTFDASGLKIKIVYSDNTKSDEIAVSELTIANPDLTTKGTKDVTVKYNVGSTEYSTSYQVTVEDHSLAHTNSISATCTTAGNIEYWYCSECEKYYSDPDASNEVSKANTDIQATGHSYGSWVHDDKSSPSAHTKVCNNNIAHEVTENCTFTNAYTNPTCTENGYTTYTCTGCGYSYKEYDDPDKTKGHNYGAWIHNENSVPSTHTRVCANDSNHDETEECGFDDGVYTQPTCTENGYTTYTCAECEYSYRVYDDPDKTLDHSGDKIVCNNNGTHSNVCDACDGKYNQTDCTIEDHLCTVCQADVTRGLAYTYRDNCYTVTGKGTATIVNLVIPSSYNDGTNGWHPVTSIGRQAFYSCLNLIRVTIPSSVTSIGDDAFNDCSNLERVIFGEGCQLETIGYSAFCQCTVLTKITISSSVTSIGGDAFSYCSCLATVYIDSATVAAGITSDYSDGYLVSSARTIYIETNISTIGSYITTNYTKAELTETFNNKTYYKYTIKQ